MRVISCEYDVVKVMASEMLNYEISHYLFYKGRVIEWSNPAMTELNRAMLISSKNLNTDMFIKYSLPITRENIEAQYKNAPMYPIYQDGYDGASLGVYTNGSLEVDGIRTFKIYMPLLYNTYKFIKALVYELRSYPVFKAQIFDTKDGSIYEDTISNRTVVRNHKFFDYMIRWMNTSLRAIDICELTISKSESLFEADKDLGKLVSDGQQGRVTKHRWIFDIEYNDMQFNEITIYIDYLNLYNGARFVEDKQLARYPNVRMWECNVNFLIPSLYTGMYIKDLELLETDTVKEGLVSADESVNNPCYSRCAICPNYANHTSLHMGAMDIKRGETLCLHCFHYYRQNTPALNKHARNFDIKDYRFFYTGVIQALENDKSKLEVPLQVLISLFDKNNKNPIGYAKNKGTIAKINDMINKRTIMIFDNAADLADLKFDDNTLLIYAVKHKGACCHDDTAFEYDYQRL